MRRNCGQINSSFEHSSPEDFVKSQWQTKEKSVGYLIYRWAVACYYIFSVITSLTVTSMRRELHIYPIYLTHWNLVFTMISMLAGAVLVTLYYRDRLNVEGKMTRKLKAYWFLSTSSSMYAFLVSLIYWTVLYKPATSVIDLNNIVVHVTNSLVIIIDLMLVKHSSRVGQFLYPLLCGFVFLFFTWLYPLLGGVNR